MAVQTKQRLSELTRAFSADLDLTDFLHRVAGLVARTVDGDIAVGITVIRDGQPGTVASSDHRAADVDDAQYEVDAGPCLEAARTGKTVVVTNMSTDTRWPSVQERAMKAGLCSSMSRPLAGLAGAVGALNMYAGKPNNFSAEDRAAAEQLAAEIDAVIAAAVRMSDRTEVSEQLEQALTSRATIDQAVGIVMAQSRCSPQEAFALLSSASQNRNLKLRDLAAELVGSVARHLE